ncbi:dienelactone hydrolase family protein, partial [Haliea sp. AH-315-K21]|nr:dienelactone hydrolase family protein [Haliea sp. AH-315-K21]
MCHDTTPSSLPTPGKYQLRHSQGLKYWDFSNNTDSDVRVALLTDIYGCNEFYQSMSTLFAAQGWQSHLIDLFSDLGELPEATRDAAFERRHKLHDKKTYNLIAQYILDNKITAVVGFCLGGNFVFELARRNVKVNLIAYYPFPAGLPNQDGLDPAFSYLEQLQTDVTVLIGDDDDRVGLDNVTTLKKISESNAAL